MFENTKINEKEAGFDPIKKQFFFFSILISILTPIQATYDNSSGFFNTSPFSLVGQEVFLDSQRPQVDHRDRPVHRARDGVIVTKADTPNRSAVVIENVWK